MRLSDARPGSLLRRRRPAGDASTRARVRRCSAIAVWSTSVWPMVRSPPRWPPAASDTVVVPPGMSSAFLAPWPLSTLDRPELVDVLNRLGLRTLSDFAALPARDVLARFGNDGATAHRLAAGLDERPPATRPPPPELTVQAELDPPAERVDTAAFVGRALADELHARLSARGHVCTRLLIVAETEHNERLERLWRLDIAGTSAGVIADRVRWQLDGWLNGTAAHRPSAGITLLRLVPDELATASGRQLGFWGGGGRSRRAGRARPRARRGPARSRLGHRARVVRRARAGRAGAARACGGGRPHRRATVGATRVAHRAVARFVARTITGHRPACGDRGRSRRRRWRARAREWAGRSVERAGAAQGG